ncbi:hypothetical protein CR513_26006, partial [Mucuna pruriens]
MDRSIINATSGEALMDKTIHNRASQPRMVNEIGVVDNLRLENQLTDLTSLVMQLVVGQHQPSIAARVCGICTSVEHPTDMCPTLQEIESDYPKNGYQYGKQAYQSQSFNNQQFGKQPFWPGPSTTVLATTIVENANSRQLTISRGPEVPTNHELQQYAVLAKYNATIQDLKLQIGQLANTVSHLQSARSSNLSSQTIPNPRGNPTSQHLPRSIDANSESDANSQGPQQDKTIPLSFPTRTLLARKPKSDEELLRMFRKFLKELCVHKRKKIKGSVEVGGIVAALTKNDDFTVGAQQALPKKCREPIIFSVPCTIDDRTFVDAMLDLGASINVMPTLIYKSSNFGDLEPTGMIIQLANRSVVQPLGVLKDVLVQVNELIFPANFYVLDIEDKTSKKGPTLILG